MNHNLIIECGEATSDELLEQWEMLANGVADYNAAWFRAHPDEVDMPMPRYESPRAAGGVAAQRVGCAPVVRRRGKATCVEWAAYCCGAMRHAGVPCEVLLVNARSPKHGQDIPYEYHAVVRDENGVIHDVTADLPGYLNAPSMGHPDAPWWERLGHCCEKCALEEDGHKTPCAGCMDSGCADAVCPMDQLDSSRGRHYR